MKELDKEFTVNFGHFDMRVWYELMGRFQDANLYQAWSYDMVRYGQKGVAQMILRKRNAVVAAAQARIIRLPGIRTGIAYIRWGPMWRLAGAPEDEEVFRQAVRALRNEFSYRRGLFLRVYPLAYRDGDESLENILNEEGYLFQDVGKTARTLIIDLKPSLEKLRVDLDQKWRNCLNRAEKNGLELISGEEEFLFDEIAKIYWEMVRRKALVDLSDINHLKMVQKDLPQALKLKVVLARLHGEICAGAIFSPIGKTGVYLSGATGDAGMKMNGSYIVQWAIVKWLKQNGFSHYDLNGINPDKNPGTYHFKRGLAGKRGRDVEFLGKFQVADSLLSDWVVNGGEWLLSGYRRIVQAGRSLRNEYQSPLGIFQRTWHVIYKR
jgi:hypothetical protein